jgi:DNA-binding XRE family transcriptional regulator
MKPETIKTKTTLAAALDVSRSTVYTWIEREILPAGPPWDIEECKAAIEEYEAELEADTPSTELKERKLELECKRLVVSIQREKELLRQSKVETQKQEGELVNIRDATRDFQNAIQGIRHACDSWVQHTIAKHPQHVALVEDFRNTLFTAIINHKGESEND